MTKQVSPDKYNREYFKTVYSTIDYGKRIDLSDYDNFSWPISELIKVDQGDKVVDFGCGAGQLSFYLAAKYKCSVIGIDYSPDAILESKRNKGKFIKVNQIPSSKTIFLQKNNNNLPSFENIKVVYLQDVIEHMYDEEISMILDKFKTWNDKVIYIALRTDNNLYLKLLRPLFDLFLIFKSKELKKSILDRGRWENERHINLTTAGALSNKLLKKGFKIEKITYSPLSEKKIKLQLGKLANFKPVFFFFLFSFKIAYFLRPSFFILASYKAESRKGKSR